MLIFLFLFWIILNGRITLEILIIGGGITLAVYFLARRHLGYTVGRDLRMLRKLPWFILYILVLIQDMLQSTLRVLHYVYSPKYQPEPVISEFYVHFHTNAGAALLANYITLTPGTITVWVEKNHFRIHCLDEEFIVDPESNRMIGIIQKMEEI